MPLILLLPFMYCLAVRSSETMTEVAVDLQRVESRATEWAHRHGRHAQWARAESLQESPVGAIAEQSNVDLLYRDADLVAVTKPSGLVVHRGWAKDSDVLMMRVRDTVGAHVWPLHRLDRGTSGVVLFALSKEAARATSEAFANGAVEKEYLALVRGVPPARGRIDNPVPKTDVRPSRAARRAAAAGRPTRVVERVAAVTDFQLLISFGRYSLVKAMPRTGRLHQVRRHLKHISCPLIGDVRYGKGEHNRLFRQKYGLHRLCLHALSAQLPHPRHSGPLHIVSILPDDLLLPLLRLADDSGVGAATLMRVLSDLRAIDAQRSLPCH